MTSMLLPIAISLTAPVAAEGLERRALVVGINDGGGELAPLRYAEDDALKFAGVLQDLGGYQPGEITVLLSPEAAALGAALDDAAAALEGSDEGLFLFYYSGHADAQGLRLGAEVLSYEALKAGIRQVPADVHLGVLDACRSGAITRVKGASISSPFLVEEALMAEGEAWLTASAADEDAQESDSLGGSFFTYYLISGLRGAADAGGDGQVSLGEAYAYAYDRTVSRTGGTEAGTQHPTYDFQLQGNGELQLTALRQATAQVTFPEEMTGEITVLRQPDNTPVAEVSKLTGKVVTLALEPGRYLLRRREAGELQEVNLSLSTGADHLVARWGDTVPEAAGRKGREDPEAAPPEDIEVVYISDLPGALEELGEDLLDGGELERLQEFDWSYRVRHSPLLAGSASALMPGAGQAYNGEWFKGALFLGGVISLSGTGYGLSALGSQPTFIGSPLGPNAATLMGTALYGWSIADAGWNARREGLDFRPKTVVTLSAETAWLDDPQLPHAAGFAVDWVLHPGISLGFDRTGYVRVEDEWAASLGGRFMVAGEGQRIRPAIFAASGVRFGTTAMSPSERRVRQIFSGGFNCRWYLTPRYFVNYEYRYELDGGVDLQTHGGGLGVHLGGREG